MSDAISELTSRCGAKRIATLGFLRHYVVTMRPYLLFVSGATGLAGLALTPIEFSPMFFVIFAIFFFSYGLGQALTDCFQTDTDSISSPYRPLTMGKIRKSQVLSVSLAGLISGGLILVAANRTNILLVSLSIFGLSTYTFFKRRWWGGPFYNAWIVAALCLMAYLSGNGIAHQEPKLAIPLISTLAATFWGYANFVLAGYFKDISADRATGYNTLPVVFGRVVSAIVSDIFAVLFLVSAGVAVGSVLAGNGLSSEKLVWVIPAAAGTIAALTAQIRLHRENSDEMAFGAISPVVHAYILILSAMASASRPSFIILAALLYPGFLIAMKLRPQKEQI